MQEGKLTTLKIDYESYASVKKLRLRGLGRKRAQIQARKALSFLCKNFKYLSRIH